MRRGTLPSSVLLQHACLDPPSALLGCSAATSLQLSLGSSSSPRARSSLLVVSTRHKSRRRYGQDNDISAACAWPRGPIRLSGIARRHQSAHSLLPFAPSASSSSPSSCSVSRFGLPSAAASFRHRTLNSYYGGQFGRSLTLGGSLLLTWRSVDKISESGIAWWSTRSWSLDSRGHGVRPQPLFCQGRTRLTVMADPGVVPEGYRPNVGLCLVNENDEIFVASRLDVPDSWQMPQGGVDDGEDTREAAIRELREETGVTTAQIIGEVPEWLTYDFPPDVRSKVGELWGTDWKGQAQKWFLFRLTGDESEINLAGDGSEKPEFGDWKWSSQEDVLKLVVDFKRPVYIQVFKSLASHIDSWSKL